MVHATWIEGLSEDMSAAFIELTKTIIGKILKKALDDSEVVICVAIGSYARTFLRPLCDIYGTYCVDSASPFNRDDTFKDTNVFKVVNEVFSVHEKPAIVWSK